MSVLKEKNLNPIFSFIFPSVCIFCLKYSKYKVCHYCRGKLMLSCGKPNLDNNVYHFGKIYCFGRYSGILRERLIDYKFKKELWLGRCFGELMYEMFRNEIIENRPDIITYVPISKSRFQERGFNQSREIAERFSRLGNFKCVALLKCNETNTKQSKLDRKQRLTSIHGKFEICSDVSIINNKKILLIDDIFTTGSTLNECGNVLSNFGAKTVDAMVVASGHSDLL